MVNFIFGRNNVLELVRESSRSISKIILMKNMKENNKVSKIIELAKEKGIIYQFLPREKFIKYEEYAHQGVIAYVSPVKYKNIDILFRNDKKYKKIIITDGVEDPHNLGSIIRTAVCAGFDAVILPSRRNATINATVEKSSAGAVNLIDLILVNSLSAAIDRLKSKNFWIIATDIKADDNYYEIDYCNMNFAIIMGSEGKGISSTLLNKADFKIKIPILNKFDSLNVANAASIVMYEAVKQTLQNSGD